MTAVKIEPQPESYELTLTTKIGFRFLKF